MQLMDEVRLILDSCVRGYHVYQDLWNATPGETLTCAREQGNRNNIFALAVKSDGYIVGHVPRHISCICTLFICRGGVLNCLTTSSRRYSRDLLQGGMEIPCQYIFCGNKDLVEKIRGCLERATRKGFGNQRKQQKCSCIFKLLASYRTQKHHYLCCSISK